uniref:Uncharacterized protein n=1 Tax=Salix viminalis TaxID=40686 RepID=A0A6N2JZR9_SALVM
MGGLNEKVGFFKSGNTTLPVSSSTSIFQVSRNLTLPVSSSTSMIPLLSLHTPRPSLFLTHFPPHLSTPLLLTNTIFLFISLALNYFITHKPMNHQLNLFFPKIVAFFFNQSRPKTRRSLSRSLSVHQQNQPSTTEHHLVGILPAAQETQLQRHRAPLEHHLAGDELQPPSRPITTTTKKKYAFPEEDEAIVRKIWEDKARTSLNQQLARARIAIFCKRSKTSKQNRLKQTDGKISTHSGGSVSFASYRASMQEQAGGKELPWDEVFSALHQKSNETGTFVDNWSKIVVEKYRNEMVARYGPDQNNHPSFDGAAWCEASGGVSKGRVYGAPRMPKSKVELMVGHMGLSMSIPMAPSMPSIVAPFMPSPVAPSMPSPVAPSMPSPTMAPGHRPRPRPQMPYNGPSSSHQQHRRSFPKLIDHLALSPSAPTVSPPHQELHRSPDRHKPPIPMPPSLVKPSDQPPLSGGSIRYVDRLPRPTSLSLFT